MYIYIYISYVCILYWLGLLRPTVLRLPAKQLAKGGGQAPPWGRGGRWGRCGVWQHLDDLSMAILGSHVHWRGASIGSCIFASPCCKEHLQDLSMAVLGREAQRYCGAWGVGLGDFLPSESVLDSSQIAQVQSNIWLVPQVHTLSLHKTGHHSMMSKTIQIPHEASYSVKDTLDIHTYTYI